ncbi:hypothetical protein [Agromyces sp. GXS1127]|uniref:hypothetical protein n=1 Tax=Agromyces sp. GXS1127 TaxID=3424181 RepID=UPI003D323898
MKLYRPSRGFRFANFAGSMVLSAMGLSFLSMFPSTGAYEALLIGVPPVAFGVAWAWRIGRLRVAYDESYVYVVGWLGSTKIPRAKVNRVETDPRTARVAWERADGGVATTPLAAVAAGRSYALPASTLKAQRQFLNSLKKWAEDR